MKFPCWPKKKTGETDLTHLTLRDTTADQSFLEELKREAPQPQAKDSTSFWQRFNCLAKKQASTNEPGR